jgi:hypothetical protein
MGSRRGWRPDHQKNSELRNTTSRSAGRERPRRWRDDGAGDGVLFEGASRRGRKAEGDRITDRIRLEPHLISTWRSPEASTVRAGPAGRLPGVHPPCRPARPMPSHSLGSRLPAHPGNPSIPEFLPHDGTRLFGKPEAHSLYREPMPHVSGSGVSGGSGVEGSPCRLAR